MAAPDIEPHQPPSKIPRQLVIVVVLAFAVPTLVVLLLANLASTGMQSGAGSTNAEAVAERIRPVAQVNIGQPGGEGEAAAAASPAPATAASAPNASQPAAQAKGGKTGEQVVQATCAACHQTGAAGAPKIGDKAAWAPRIAQGEKVLLQSALQGKGAMPAKGGNPQLSDAEVERAVVYMADKVGAAFKAPGSGGKAAK